jgi:hypothetical protein
MKKGDIVIFEGKSYKVIWIYDNGNIEITRDLNTLLVHKDEVVWKEAEN